MRTFAKTSVTVLTLIVVLLSVFLASCSSSQARDPVSIVQTAYARINEGNVDGFMELLSDDAVVVDRNGRYAGSETIRKYLEQDFVPQHIRIELSNLSSNGNDVTYTSKIYLGDKLLATYNDGLDVVVNGQIIFDGTEEYRLPECSRGPSQAFCPSH